MTDTSDFEARFSSVEEAALRLSGDVQALTATLRVVNDLQIEQRETRLRQEKTALELEQNKHDAEERDRRTRSVVRYIGFGSAIILLLIAILVYWALLLRVNQLLDEQNANAYSSCLVRNQATIDNATRERELAAAETNPTIKKIHEDSAAKLGSQTNNCNRFLKDNPDPPATTPGRRP